jgi:ribosomal protein S18 acetylase RimI-like enzyme
MYFVDLKIRNAVRDDQKHFVEIYSKAYKGLEQYAYTTNREIKSYFRWLMGRDPNGVFVAEVDKPVGFIACDANWYSSFENKVIGEIHEIFVHPEWQKRGIGEALVFRGLEYLKSKGRDTIGLWVGATNYKAKKFYEKFGFRESGSWGRWIRMILKLTNG